jgi:release factor glutamine methyltransferase
MSEAFNKTGLDSPRLLAELLMAHVTGTDRLRLYMDADRPASALERDTLRALVARALRHEPVQYLVGEAWFFGLPLHVTPDVLIPRPSTETLVEQALLHTRAEPGFGGKSGEGVRVADVCTGSGAVVIALLKNLPGATGIASDLSPAALAVAARNAARHGLEGRLSLVAGDGMAPIVDHPAGGGAAFHAIVANPPYIPDSEWNDPAMMDRSVREFEPTLALRGGPDGLNILRPLVEAAPASLLPRGLLALETAAATAKAVADQMRAHPLLDPSSVRIAKDFEGLDRVVVGVRK